MTTTDPEVVEYALLFIDSLFQRALDFDREQRTAGIASETLVRETLTVAREYGLDVFELDFWTAELDRQMEGERTNLAHFAAQAPVVTALRKLKRSR